MLAEQPRGARAAQARPVGHRIEHDLDRGRVVTGGAGGRQGHGQQSEPEPAAERAHVRPVRAGARAMAAAGSPDRQVHAIREREPGDALEQQAEVERELELDDHRRILAAGGDDVAPADLGLDVVALRFEERLDRRIEIAFARGARRHDPSILHPAPRE
jgi:hypothetical protein